MRCKHGPSAGGQVARDPGILPADPGAGRLEGNGTIFFKESALPRVMRENRGVLRPVYSAAGRGGVK